MTALAPTSKWRSHDRCDPSAHRRRPVGLRRRPASSLRHRISNARKRVRRGGCRAGCGLRWQTTDRSIVRSAPAFLAATTTRLAINVVQSARSRRETPSEPWLTETADASADSGLEAERGEALELAVLLLLEKLSPTERAAYVLSEAFDYPYAWIADVLQVSQANARQIASRARKHLAALKKPLDADLASDSRPFSLRSSSALRRGRRAARGAHARGRSGDPAIAVRHRPRCHELPTAPVSLMNGREATPKGAHA